MRILIVDTCYPAFLASHYRRSPGLEREPYAIQWRTLMETFFGTADSYSHFLAAAGHEAHEVIVNSEHLQRAWAQEHRKRPRGLGLRRRPLVLDQADWLDADVVYVQNPGALAPRILRKLGRGRLLAGQVGSRPPSDDHLGSFRLLLTSFPHFVERFRARGLDAEYLRIGFDPRVLDHAPARSVREGAVFVGALHRGRHRHGNAVVEAAARRAPIDFWGYGAEEWPTESPIRRRYRGEAWGLDMYSVLGRAKVAVNRHVETAEDFANNMRLYEATGMGALLLTEAKRNLGEIFELGREAVAYANADELAQLTLHYLEHEDERDAIARAGQQRTLREHSYADRMRELGAILAARLS